MYGASLIGAWKGSMLFVTLKDANLRRLTFGPDGSVTGDEVLLDGRRPPATRPSAPTAPST